MTDNELRRLWRQHTDRCMPAQALEGYEDSVPSHEGAVVAMAEDARLADIGRAVVGLRGEAEALSAAVATLRGGARRRVALRPAIGFALAASAALMAVIVLPRGEGQGVESAPAAEAAPPLFAGSFEGKPAAERADGAHDAVFRGGFDS